MPWCVRRNSDTQVALLDRIAGTAAQAARFGAQLRRLREAEGGLAALDALGDQDDRDALQALIDEARSPFPPTLGAPLSMCSACRPDTAPAKRSSLLLAVLACRTVAAGPMCAWRQPRQMSRMVLRSKSASSRF